MLRFLIAILVFTNSASLIAAWTTREEANSPDPGKSIEIARDGKPIARFVFGEGQLKPFLHVYGENGELLTEWDPKQQFPHHRGIFIGWNRIRSELGVSDLWHLSKAEKMVAVEVRHTAEKNRAVIVAKIEWHAAKGDDIGDTILVNETRRLVISRPSDRKTQVDAAFTLKAARDLTLDGDLQHAGVHFRGAKQLSSRAKETRYLWEPDLPPGQGKVVSPDLKWCRLIFPIETNWYSATQLNSPTNPTAELSWRDYGRFGFFFKKELKWGDELEVKYRFITQPAAAPTTEGLAVHRAESAEEYKAFLKR
jgi:hypothetical protein